MRKQFNLLAVFILLNLLGLCSIVSAQANQSKYVGVWTNKNDNGLKIEISQCEAGFLIKIGDYTQLTSKLELRTADEASVSPGVLENGVLFIYDIVAGYAVAKFPIILISRNEIYLLGKYYVK